MSHKLTDQEFEGIKEVVKTMCTLMRDLRDDASSDTHEELLLTIGEKNIEMRNNSLIFHQMLSGGFYK